MHKIRGKITINQTIFIAVAPISKNIFHISIYFCRAPKSILILKLCSTALMFLFGRWVNPRKYTRLIFLWWTVFVGCQTFFFILIYRLSVNLETKSKRTLSRCWVAMKMIKKYHLIIGQNPPSLTGY